MRAPTEHLTVFMFLCICLCSCIPLYPLYSLCIHVRLHRCISWEVFLFVTGKYHRLQCVSVLVEECSDKCAGKGSLFVCVFSLLSRDGPQVLGCVCSCVCQLCGAVMASCPQLPGYVSFQIAETCGSVTDR